MIFRLSAIAVISAFGFILLKKDRADFAFVLELGVTAGILIAVFPLLETIIEAFYDMTQEIKMESIYFKIPVKCCGIALISKLICELCKDVGENALSVKFELASKVLILITSLPIFRSLFDLIKSLLESM